MAFNLRPYQARATSAAIDRVRRSVDPVLIDAAPAAGKSFMIAELADELHRMSGGKRVLCLAPSATLVEQNFEKFKLTGEKASIFSASAGSKSTRHFIVFGTPGTVKNSISKFQRDYCAVIVDEVHGLTPTIRAIIDAMRESNPMLRVVGLTGTPYRLGTGYIFRQWPDGRNNGDDTCQDPYFTHCVYRVSAREMLDEGFITPMDIGSIHAESYDTSGVRLLPNGHPVHEDLERAFEGHGRKTSAIVGDVMHLSRHRAGGIMYFAATIPHAREVLASLPVNNSAMVTGDESIMFGKSSTRKEVVKSYREKKFRHLVSVGTLTTGFDVSHTEVIALLRYTESAALVQQILGRAWRLDDAKDRSLLLDYAGNVERHFEDGDIYNPVIKARKGKDDKGGFLPILCPDCGYENAFSGNDEYIDMPHDENGYLMGLDGHRIEGEFGHISVHYGRRCNGLVRMGALGQHDRCGYRWNGKPCPSCDEMNDIAARYCYACKAEIVDPNERLSSEFKALKKDPHQVQVDEVLSVTFSRQISKKERPMVLAKWVTPYRHFATYHMSEPRNGLEQANWDRMYEATNGMTETPRSITYVKEQGSIFYKVLSYNKEPQHDPTA